MTAAEMAVAVERALDNAGIDATVEDIRTSVATQALGHPPHTEQAKMEVTVYYVMRRKPDAARND